MTAGGYTEAKLRGIAQVQIAYEVRTLIGQINELLGRSRDAIDPAYLALVEAPLVHLRLLDDFLGNEKPRKDDVVARHYYPDWEPVRFLTDPQRDSINAQLQHLAGRRQTGANWFFAPMIVAFAEVFLRFVDNLAAADPDRGAWFEESIDVCLLIVDDIDKYPNIAHGS